MEGQAFLMIIPIIIAFLNLISSICICILTGVNVLLVKKSLQLQNQGLEIQREHYVKIVRPKCNIVSSETNNSIKVCISNYGNGVMTIDNIIIKNKNTGSICHSLFEIIPDDIKLSYYSIDTQGRDIAVKGHIILIEINNFNKAQYNKIRKILRQYEIIVNYHCLYNNKFCATKDLDVLFGKTYRNQNK